LLLDFYVQNQVSAERGARGVCLEARSRGRPPRKTFAQVDRPVNALRLCRWQYSHKETL